MNLGPENISSAGCSLQAKLFTLQNTFQGSYFMCTLFSWLQFLLLQTDFLSRNSMFHIDAALWNKIIKNKMILFFFFNKVKCQFIVGHPRMVFPNWGLQKKSITNNTINNINIYFRQK